MTFKDKLGINLESFIREIGSTKFYIENGKIVFKETIKKFQFMQPSSKHGKIFSKFVTLDIETRTINGIFVPYCISLFDGKKA